MKKTKRTLLALLAVPLAFAGFALADRITFARDAWLDDYAQLQRGLERSYANLQWSRTAKQVDLVALDSAARASLLAARTRGQARQAIVHFLEGFYDAHLHLQSGPPRPIPALMKLWPHGREPQIEFAMNGAEACDALGYSGDGFPIDTLAAGTRRFGRIRIAAFSQHQYGHACAAEWERFRERHSGPCDGQCQEQFAHAAKVAIAADLARTANRAARGHAGLVIDLTGNGGGTEWAEYAAAAMSARTLAPPRVAGIRTEHWQQQLGDSANLRCDLHPLWTDRSFQPTCWNVALLPPDTATPIVFAEPFRGTLYVLVDAGTASAAEYFAAVLQDNGAATIVGSTTMGVGCGYTNGGVTITLPHSGLVVKTPDCVRLRRDGSNEYAGVTPDLAALR